MARLRKQVLGQLQGGIADVYIKYRNGKPYVSCKPDKFNTGNDPVTLYKKNQGKFIGKLSSVIYKIDILKNIWSLSDAPKGYLYQQIWARNYRSIKNSNLSGLVTLVPSAGFKVINPIIELGKNDNGKLTIPPLGLKNGLNPAIEKKITAVGIIILKDDVPGSKFEFGFKAIKSDLVNLDLITPLELNIEAQILSKWCIFEYTIKKIYITLITLDASASPIHYSEVISGG
jgi:hypothetical protein